MVFCLIDTITSINEGRRILVIMKLLYQEGLINLIVHLTVQSSDITTGSGQVWTLERCKNLSVYNKTKYLCYTSSEM